MVDAEESAKATGRSIAEIYADDETGNRERRVLVSALAQCLHAKGGEVTRQDIGKQGEKQIWKTAKFAGNPYRRNG